MSRNPLIEAIHEARYGLKTCARRARAACQRTVDELLRQSLDRAGSKITPEQLLDALFVDDREFKRGKERLRGRDGRVRIDRVKRGRWLSSLQVDRNGNSPGCAHHASSRVLG